MSRRAEEAQPAQEQTAPPPAPLRSPPGALFGETAKEVVSAIAGFRGQIYAAFYDSGVERIQAARADLRARPHSLTRRRGA